MSLRQELAANARLRIGMAAILIILLAYGLLEWRDQQGQALLAYRRLAAQQLRLGQQQNLHLWPLRAAQAAKALPEFERQLWRQPSYGLAQAELQDWLRQQLRAINVQSPSIKISDGDPAAVLLGASSAGEAEEGGVIDPARQGWTRVSAEVEFASSDANLVLALLGSLTAHEHLLVIDALSIKPTRVELRVSAWYHLGATTGLGATVGKT